MRIEMRYHDAAEKLFAEIEEKVKEDEANLSEEEKAILQRQEEQELQKLLDHYMEKYGSLEKVVSESRTDRFNDIADRVSKMASYMELNTYIERKEDYHGIIILESDWTLISNETGQEAKEIISEMFMAADDIIIHTVSDLYRIEFWYELYDEIER